jgi:Zn-finger nucleic acid-binding protein
MKCLSCGEHTLKYDQTEDGLRMQKCHECGGKWISSNDYIRWRDSHTGQTEVRIQARIDVHDTKKPKMCPDCRHILMPYRVLPAEEFRIDHCGNCNGYWFDGGEWETLVQRKTHWDLTQFFTEDWQQHLRELRSRETMERLYVSRFGADYERVKEIRKWITEHPRAGMILAYLSDRDPYK